MNAPPKNTLTKTQDDDTAGLRSPADNTHALANNSKESQLTLELLQAIEQRDDISQRHLAQKMGVALGLANSYLKRCVKKGWVKVSTAPANRYFYYLTPNGFAEKARLTGEFFSTSFALFRQSGDEYTLLLQQLAKQESARLLFVGLSDLTEIALMRALQAKLPVIGVYQPATNRNDFFGVPVISTMPDDDEFNVAVLTSMEQTTELLAELEQRLPSTSILVPPMLLKMKFRTPESVEQNDTHSSTGDGQTIID